MSECHHKFFQKYYILTSNTILGKEEAEVIQLIIAPPIFGNDELFHVSYDLVHMISPAMTP